MITLTFNTRAAFGAWTQATCRAGIANERIVVCISDGFTLNRGNAFTGQRCNGSKLRLCVAFARAIKPAVVTWTIFAWTTIFTRWPVFTGPVVTLAVLARTVFAIFTRPIVARSIVTRPIFTGPIIALPVATGTIIALTVLARALFAVFAGPIITWSIITGALFTFLARWRALKRGVIAFCAEFVVFFLAVLFRPTFAVGAHGAGALVFCADAAIGNHAEVVIGKLQIVFGLHAVTVQVRVRCKFAILLQHLGGIAPCAAVDPVELLPAILGATIIGAPATAVVTTIVVIQLQALPCLGAAQLEFRPIWNAG